MSHEIINNKFRELFLPSLLIAMALNITSIVDSMFVSSFIGHNALAAIQLLEPIVLLITVFEWLFGLGGQILSLNKKAEFDEDGSNRYFTVAIVSTLVIDIIILLVCFVDNNGLLSLLHPNNAVLPYLKQYAPFLFLAFPLSTLLGVISQYVRVDGQPNFASFTIVFANVINIILDYVFLEHLHMGIQGASLATLIGYTIGFLVLLKYFFDSKRTFKFNIKMRIKSWFSSFWDIIKIGFPTASMGIFDLVFVHIMNQLISNNLGTIGLNAFTLCQDGLLIISIIVIGFAETIASIAPIYYAQYDYKNLNYMMRQAFIVSTISGVIFVGIILFAPHLFLMLYNYNGLSSTAFMVNALKLYSPVFIITVFGTMLIFYYEAIERALVSSLLSILSTFVLPLVFVFALFPTFSDNAFWICTPIGIIVAIGITLIYVKFIERREKEYHGIFLIKKDLIPKTQNYILKSRDDENKTKLFNHLSNLNANEKYCIALDKVFDNIYECNNENIVVEVVIIDYDDKITVDIKDEGKSNILENIEKDLALGDALKGTKVLGLNDTSFIINKN